MQDLTASLEKLHTTDLGAKRIRRNLDLQNAETPELAISVLPEFRGYGIGTKLMKKLFEILRDNGYARTSLSVQKDNPAVRFYERLGYQITEEKLDYAGNEDFIMVKNLKGFSSSEKSFLIFLEVRVLRPLTKLDKLRLGLPSNNIWIWSESSLYCSMSSLLLLK